MSGLRASRFIRAQATAAGGTMRFLLSVVVALAGLGATDGECCWHLPSCAQRSDAACPVRASIFARPPARPILQYLSSFLVCHTYTQCIPGVCIDS